MRRARYLRGHRSRSDARNRGAGAPGHAARAPMRGSRCRLSNVCAMRYTPSPEFVPKGVSILVVRDLFGNSRRVIWIRNVAHEEAAIRKR